MAFNYRIPAAGVYHISALVENALKGTIKLCISYLFYVNNILRVYYCFFDLCKSYMKSLIPWILATLTMPIQHSNCILIRHQYLILFTFKKDVITLWWPPLLTLLVQTRVSLLFTYVLYIYYHFNFFYHLFNTLLIIFIRLIHLNTLLPLVLLPLVLHCGRVLLQLMVRYFVHFFNSFFFNL